MSKFKREPCSLRFVYGESKSKLARNDEEVVVVRNIAAKQSRNHDMSTDFSPIVCAACDMG